MQKWFFIGLAILGLGLFLMFGTFAAIYTGLDRVLGESDMDDREWIRQAMTIGGIGFILFSIGLRISLIKRIE